MTCCILISYISCTFQQLQSSTAPNEPSSVKAREDLDTQRLMQALGDKEWDDAAIIMQYRPHIFSKLIA